MNHDRKFHTYGSSPFRAFIFLSLLTAVVFFLVPVFAETTESASLRIECPARVSGFSSNPVTVEVPEEGTLSLWMTDDGTNVYYTFCSDKSVVPGTITFQWDGLGVNEEIPDQGTYSLQAELKTDSGTLSATRKFSEIKCRETVIFALGSSDTLYLDGDEWFVEIKMVRAGTLVTEFINASEPDVLVAVKKKEITGYRVQKYDWDGMISGKRVQAGDWILRFYTEENPEIKREVCVRLVEGKRPEIPLTISGEFMPERDWDDQRIWNTMLAPAAVVDIKATSSQKIYAEKDEKSVSLGTVHGQSQSLEVMEVPGDGWVRVAAWNHETADYMVGWIPEQKLKVVTPNNRYGLLLDKKQQTLTLFENGVRTGTIKVSTGIISEGKLFNETPAGSYLTDMHMVDFSMNGQKYDYVIRYDGGNLIHQLPYRMKNKIKDYAPGESLIGAKASHGCIRLQHEPAENGLNAYWVWTHIPYRTRLIILDDPEERETERIHLQKGTITGEGFQPLAEQDDETDVTEKITLTWTGNVVLGTTEGLNGNKSAMPNLIRTEGYGWPLGEMRELFSSDDLTIVPLENVLKDNLRSANSLVRNRCRGTTDLTAVLSGTSVELAVLTGNHLNDYGSDGLASTIAALEEDGLDFLQEPKIITIRGKKIGFGSCTQKEYAADRRRIARDVRKLKEMGADVLIYCCYWGNETGPVHESAQKSMASACADEQVDLVIGCGPEYLHGIQKIKDTVVVYGLGNLVNGTKLSLPSVYGAVAGIELVFREEGFKGLSLRIIPVRLTTGKNDCRAVPADEEGLRTVLESIQNDSNFLITEEMWFEKNIEQE